MIHFLEATHYDFDFVLAQTQVNLEEKHGEIFGHQPK